MNELKKFSDAVEKMSAIRDFMRDMAARGYFLAHYHPDYNELCPVAKTTEELIYEHCEIDAEKLEQERKELLDSLR